MRQGLRLGDGGFAGAFQDEVPGVGLVQGAGAVQGGAEPVQQGGVAQLDVAQVPGGGAGLLGLAGVAAVAPRGLQPFGVQPVQERGRVVRAARRGR